MKRRSNESSRNTWHDHDVYRIRAVYPESRCHQKALQTSRLRFLVPDIGQTGDWGVPENSDSMHLWPNYALCPFLHGSVLPDLVLIDGRFRVACSLVVAMQAPSTTILVHDYTLRPAYKILEAFLTIEKTIDTLVMLRRCSPKASITSLLKSS